MGRQYEDERVRDIESAEDGVVHTIEGNSGDKVGTNCCSVGSSVVYGDEITTHKKDGKIIIYIILPFN